MSPPAALKVLAGADEACGDLADACGAFSTVADGVKAQADRAESQFLLLGEQLSSAAEALTSLVSACEQVAQDASAGETQAAADALRGAADQIHALGGAGTRQQILEQFLNRLDGAVRQIENARLALRPASAIAVGAKVEAARVGDQDEGFADFASQIADAFGLARDTLATVAGDVGGLRVTLQEACARESELARRMQTAIDHLPIRITASVEAILAHMAAAGLAAEATAVQSRSIGSGIGNAVMATQVGDAARQRMEHVGAALDLAAQACRTDAASPAEQRGLLACSGELSAAHLADTAEELLADMGRMRGSLDELGTAAERLADIGAGLGPSDGVGASEVAELRAGVAEAQLLFGELEAAWRAADDLAGSVANSARQLERRIGTIRLAETQVSRLAMNASIRCGRVGERGRALAVIAQQLQACVEQTTLETACIVESLDAVLALVEELAGGHDGVADDVRRQVGESFDLALEPLAALETRMSDSLELIRRKSGAVAALLRKTTRGLAVHEEVAEVLAAGAAELEATSRALRSRACEAGPITDRLLETVAASYTMARERAIHVSIVQRATDRVRPDVLAGS